MDVASVFFLYNTNVTCIYFRIGEVTEEITTCQTELQAQRRRSVQLEKQLGKAKVTEQGQSAKSGEVKVM